MSGSELKAQINAAVKDAMRAKEKERLGVLRLTMAEFKRIEVDERIELDDARVLAVLDKMLKQRRDSAQQYIDAGREELAAQERFEIGVIQEFLPQPLSLEDIDRMIDAAIVSSGASTMREMGQVMSQLKPQMQGRADMAEVSKRIKAKLG
ncbi:GatB/YqeY domain-containing protein [Marinimicrobium alkaliphilum]|uniref:GatB/YqeY domain-containing protein n=1 Tax=Marinimicrobium alkaliphilum TaxID=2202654 RepID=UPI000DBAA6DD|nr:GatB/YqeY domain-containing protein [Marinimicrobium alkaliphilum]